MSGNFERIILDKQDNIARIIFNEPEKRNPLGIKTMQEVAAALEDCRNDDSVRVVIVTGKGKAFCAGADIGDFKSKDVDGYREQYRVFTNLHDAMVKLGKPSIAAVNGYALAGGCGLAMLCDMGIASSEAKFGQTEINVGVFPMIVMATLCRIAPRKIVMDMIYTGRILDAQEALQAGLINKVVPSDQLENAVMALAETLKSKSSIVLKLGRDAFFAMQDLTYESALGYAREMVSLLCLTQDAQEGVAAFLEKRTPQWKGR